MQNLSEILQAKLKRKKTMKKLYTQISSNPTTGRRLEVLTVSFLLSFKWGSYKCTSDINFYKICKFKKNVCFEKMWVPDSQ